MAIKIKTIDIIALEWQDKTNGNSYFSATITTNYGKKSQKNYSLPFQYGYGEYYMQEACYYLIKHGIIEGKIYNESGYLVLWQYCKDNNIILRTTKHVNCKKRELKSL